MNVLNYYWQIIRQAAGEAWAFVVDQKIISVILLLTSGLVAQVLLKRWFPQFTDRLGNPWDRIADFAVFTVAAVIVYSLALFAFYCVTVPAKIHGSQVEQLTALSQKPPLELTYFARGMQTWQAHKGTDKEHEVYTFEPVTLVNRSKRNMSLTFELLLGEKFQGDTITVYPTDGKWKATESGDRFENIEQLLALPKKAIIDVPAESSATGILTFELGQLGRNNGVRLKIYKCKFTIRLVT